MPADVTVVVPVFDKAAFLPACLDSILGQSHRRLQVICIDDASKDGSGRILDEYAAREPRLAVIHNTVNMGAGRSRNIGIESASGQYVQFTDADDLLFPTAIEDLYETCVRDRVDLARGIVSYFDADAPDKHRILDHVADKRCFAPLDDRQFWVPWWHQSFLISRRLLQRPELRFPALSCGEDPVFLAAVLVEAECMSTLSIRTYKYRWTRLAAKGRTTFRHARDYVKHAGLVRSIFLKRKPDCWTRGYGPVVARDIALVLEQCTLTPQERATLARELAEVPPDR